MIYILISKNFILNFLFKMYFTYSNYYFIFILLFIYLYIYIIILYLFIFILIFIINNKQKINK